MQNIANLFISSKKKRMMIHNKNWLAIICGGTGTGKSYTALSLADKISVRPINISRNVVFDAEKFLKIVSNPKELKRGDILVFDEAGVNMSSREWYSIQNKLIGSVLQTFRNMNIGVIFTTPDLSYIDKQARKLFHSYFETMRIDPYENKCIVKVYNIQNHSRYDKTYFSRPRFVIDGKIQTMDQLKVGLPRKELIDEYEVEKSKFTKKLNKEAYEELKNNKQKGKRKHKHSWVFRKKKNEYECRVCGKMRKTNPFD